MKIVEQDRIMKIIILLGVGLVLAGCATQSTSSAAAPAGFLLGMFHGFTIFFSLIGSAFLDVEIYAYPNTGLLYDAGYFIGVSSFLGAGGAGARAKKDR